MDFLLQLEVQEHPDGGHHLGRQAELSEPVKRFRTKKAEFGKGTMRADMWEGKVTYIDISMYIYIYIYIYIYLQSGQAANYILHFLNLFVLAKGC